MQMGEIFVTPTVSSGLIVRQTWRFPLASSRRVIFTGGWPLPAR